MYVCLYVNNGASIFNCYVHNIYVGDTNKLTNIADVQYEFHVMTKNIGKVLSSTIGDVTAFIEKLQTLYAVDYEKVPLFEKDTFSEVETFDSLWEKLSSYWNIFDYDLLYKVTKFSKEATLIFQEFTSKIDPFIQDWNFVLVSEIHERKGNKKDLRSLLRIKVNAKICNCYAKNKVKKLLSEVYKLENYALCFKEITKGCIEINLKATSGRSLTYIREHDIYGRDIPKFADLKIRSIRIDNEEIRLLPVDPVSPSIYKKNSKFKR